MKITELAEVMECHLEVVYSASSSCWIAQFQDSEVYVGNVISIPKGCGSSPEAAMENYVDSIRGRVLVVSSRLGAKDQPPREFYVPSTLKV